MTAPLKDAAGATAGPASTLEQVMQKHFVNFYSPGSFFAEQSTMPIPSWDVEQAKELAHGVKERYGATPYGFSFSTRARGSDDLDSKEVARSAMYYLGGKVETLEEVEARNDPKEAILRSNMRGNGYARIIVNDNSWRFTGALKDGDVVLDWEPRATSLPTTSGEPT